MYMKPRVIQEYVSATRLRDAAEQQENDQEVNTFTL